MSYYNAKKNSTSLLKRPSAESDLIEDNRPSNDVTAGLDVVDETVSPAAVEGNIVWAGLEPIEFIAIFPDWIERKDIAQINIQVSDSIYTRDTMTASTNNLSFYINTK